MKGMALVTLLAVVGALGWLRFTMGEALTIHMIIATAAGVGLSVMLGAALMDSSSCRAAAAMTN